MPDKKVVTSHAKNYLNTEEQHVLYEYYDGYPHNSMLRKGVNPSTIKDVVILDGEFAKAPVSEDEAVVYRTVHRPPVFEEQNKFIVSLKEGHIINDASYISTSTDVSNNQFMQFVNSTIDNGGVLMRIKLPKGIKGIYGGYDEFLLPKNSQIKINKIEIIDGHKIAGCEYILP